MLEQEMRTSSVAVVTRSALQIIRSAPTRRERLARLVDVTGPELGRSCGMAGSGSNIAPVIVGTDLGRRRPCRKVRARGLDVRAIRPPPSRRNTGRLRIALTLKMDGAIVTIARDARSRIEDVAMSPPIVVGGTEKCVNKTVSAALIRGAGSVYWGARRPHRPRGYGEMMLRRRRPGCALPSSVL